MVDLNESRDILDRIEDLMCPRSKSMDQLSEEIEILLRAVLPMLKI